MVAHVTATSMQAWAFEKTGLYEPERATGTRSRVLHRDKRTEAKVAAEIALSRELETIGITLTDEEWIDLCDRRIGKATNSE